MVKINRTPAPDKYNIYSDVFLEILIKDCHDKCYICEQTDFTDAEKEHIIAHLNGDSDLKNDWNNILLCCSHCNGVKGTERIIDCTKTDPEKYIELRYENNGFQFEEDILVEIKDKNNFIEFLHETVAILRRVYNSNKPALTKHNSKTLRSKVNKKLAEFRKRLYTYISETDNILKNRYFDKIKKLIHVNTQFSAFKRQIIKDSDFLYRDFKEALNAIVKSN